MRECLQDKSLQWFGHLQRMEANARSNKLKTLKVSGSFPEDDLGKHRIK